MSTNLELENWDPMAEDYSSSKFNSYNDENSSQLYDFSSLFVRNIPHDLKEETFASYMSSGGRKLKRFRLFPSKPNHPYKVGLCEYFNEADAQAAVKCLQAKPPLNLKIQYKEKRMDGKQDTNEHSFQNVRKGVSPSPLNLHSLKVVLDDGKRTAYHDDSTIANGYPEDPSLPNLISNPFLLCICKEIGRFSCETCQQPYCSAKCQKEDWLCHKLICFPVNKTSQKSKNETSRSKNSCTNDSSYVSDGSSSSDYDIKPTSKMHTNVIGKSKAGCSSEPSSKFVPTSVLRTSKERALFSNDSSKDGHNHQVIEKKLTFVMAEEIKKTVLHVGSKGKVNISSIHSPSKFWVQLDANSKTLSEMEEQLSLKVERKPATCPANSVCCTLHDGKLKRVKILKKNCSTSVYFLDYGGTAMVENDKLFHLPEKFKKYPAQAICCSLVDSWFHNKLTTWAVEQVSYFRDFSLGNSYQAEVHKCFENVYYVSICNEECLCLYTVLESLLNNQTRDEDQDTDSKSLLSSIPSACTNLKEKMEVTIAAVEFEEDKFWGVLDDGTDLAKTLKEIENLLLNNNSPDICNKCEEGDVAVGFSPSFNQYYRCFVLKRLKSSFLVRYIDYGNQEEITSLSSMPSDLMLKKSHVICCEKPNTLSHIEFKTIFENTMLAVVKSVQNTFVELTCTVNFGKVFSLRCFPWCHDFISCSISKMSSINDLSHQSLVKEVKNINQSQKSLKPPLAESTKKISINDILPKKITADMKYSVKIVFIKTTSELYVQLSSDEKDINLLCVQLNQHCNSNNTSDKYIPVKDEIVCCKYSSDGNWYRGQVLGKSDNKFRIFFIDFGNEENVPDVNIKHLPERFAYPKFSICVSLYNLKNEDISRELLLKLTEEIWLMQILNIHKSPVEVMLSQDGKSLIDYKNKKPLVIQKLPLGKPVEVYVCNTKKNKIFLHQVKDLKSLTNLSDKITTLKKENPFQVRVKGVYCALSDGSWYRVSVEEELSPNTFIVNFIDYGNQKEMSINNIRVLPDELLTFPAYSIPVIAENLDIINWQSDISYSVEVVGEENDIQKVKFINSLKLCPFSSLKKLHLNDGVNSVLFCHAENEIYHCQLLSRAEDFVAMSEKLQNCTKQNLFPQVASIGDLLCAKSTDGCWYRASVEDIFSRDSTYKVLFFDYGNRETVSYKNVMQLPDEFSLLPIYSIPVKIKDLDRVKKHIRFDSALDISTIDISSNEVQVVELLLPKSSALPKITSLKKQMLPVDRNVRVFIVYNEGNIFYTLQTDLVEMMDSLSSILLKSEEFTDLKDLPEIGDVLCVKFTDGLWYRGSVEEICSDNKTCKINFIDFGNKEIITLDNMKILPSDICSFPVLAVPVKLRNFEVLESQPITELTVVTVRVVGVTSENIQVLEILSPELEMKSSSVNIRILSEDPVEVFVSHKEESLYFVQKCSDLEVLQEMQIGLLNSGFEENISHVPKIGELLCAKFVDQVPYRGVVKEECNHGTYKVFFIDYGNTDIINVTNMYVLPSKYLTLPAFSMAVKLLNSHLTNPLKTECKYTVKYTGTTLNDIQIIDVFPSFPKIFISSMKTSVLEEGVSEISVLSFDGEFYSISKPSDTYERNKMEALLENFKSEEIHHVPSTNEVFLIKLKDKIWYRACVTEIIESLGCYKLYLIDLGTEKEAAAAHLYYMPETFKDFPVFSIKVQLNPDSSLVTPLAPGQCYDVYVEESKTENVPVVNIIHRYMFDSLKHHQLPLLQPRKVMFVHREQDVLYLQDISDVEMKKNVYSEVAAEVVNTVTNSRILLHNPRVGELLCVLSCTDSVWYRGYVTEIMPSNKYKIQYVDFGNHEVLSKENLCPFTDKLMDYPSLSIPVHIKGGGGGAIVLEQPYTVIAESEAPGYAQLVRIESGMQTPPTTRVSNGDETCSKSVFPDMKLTVSSKFTINDCKLVSFSSGEQDVVIFKISEEDGALFAFCAPFVIENVFAYDQLSKEITDFCSNSLPLEDRNYSPEVDELVLAKYKEDEKWYRAVIINKSPILYEVLFVDYGNMEQVPKDCLKKMEKRFMSLDIQADLCLMTGFQINEQLPVIINELKIEFLNQPLKAEVTVLEEYKSLNIPVITEHLVEKKWATSKEN